MLNFKKGLINLKKIISILYTVVLVVALSVQPVYASSTENTTETDTQESIPPEDAPDIHSEAAIVMDAATGQILYEKNAYTTLYPASITKILTTLVALENNDINSVITMSEEAVYGIDWDSTHIGLKAGEQITVKDALYATMLASANEAAWGLAEHTSGDLETFCTLMNDRAKEIGCIGTNFVNANGLHNDNHYTCAYDMALITKEALKNPDFVTIASTRYYEIEPTSYTPETRYLVQGNQLQNPESEYYYKYCYGGKVGYTNMAQGTLVSWAQQDGVTLICVTMKASLGAYKYMDTTALFDYAFDKYAKMYPLNTFQFTSEDIANTEAFLNDYYGGKNLGKLTLTADLSTYVLAEKDTPYSHLDTIYEMSTEELDEHISGYLKIYHEDTLLHSIPVYFDGYINSEDEAAVEAAIAAGIIKRPINFSFGKFFATLIIVGILLVVGRYYYKKMSYVRKKRKEYIRRRNEARKNGDSF